MSHPEDAGLIVDIDAAIMVFQKRFLPIVKETEVQLLALEAVIPIGKDVLEKHGLNEHITIGVSWWANELTVMYFYDHYPIKPISTYIPTKDYKKISILQILKECIRLNTYCPDVRPLEVSNVLKVVATDEINKQAMGGLSDEEAKANDYFRKADEKNEIKYIGDDGPPAPLVFPTAKPR